MAANIVPIASAMTTPPRGRLVTAEPVHRFKQSFGGTTPDEVSNVLSQLDRGYGEKWIDLKGHMLKVDGHLRSKYRQRRLAVAGTPFEISAGRVSRPGDEQLAAEAADFCALLVDHIGDLETWFVRMLDGVGAGWATSENVWERGPYGSVNAWFTQPEWIHPRRLRFVDRHRPQLWDGGRCDLMLDEVPGKFIIHTPSAEAEYPIDSGELLSCVWYWLLKTWGWKFWSSATERFGNPIIIAKVPENTPVSAIQDLLTKLRAISATHAGVIKNGETIDVVPPAAQGSTDIWSKQIEMLNDEMTKTLIGTTDVRFGLAAVETGEQVRTESAEFDAKALANTIRRYVFGPALAFNRHLFGGRMPPIPTMRFRVGEERRPIPQSLIDQGGVTIDQLLTSAGLPAIGGAEGNRKTTPTGKNTAMTQPAQPSQPSQPNQPVQPSQPSEPLDPTEE